MSGVGATLPDDTKLRENIGFEIRILTHNESADRRFEEEFGFGISHKTMLWDEPIKVTGDVGALLGRKDFRIKQMFVKIQLGIFGLIGRCLMTNDSEGILSLPEGNDR